MMDIYRKGNRKTYGSCVAIGSFDGIHQAHVMIVEQALKLSRERNVLCGVVTFYPNPQVFIYRQFPFLLTTEDEKRAILERMGVDFLFIIPFTDEIRKTEPYEFLKAVVYRQIRPCVIMIGHNHRFGKERLGDVSLMRTVGEELGFEVKVVPALIIDTWPVSSTRIREKLLLGDIQKANALLGRRYSLSGTIVQGKGRGRKIGFPTINFKVRELEKLIPADGVYAVITEVKGSRYNGVMNIGHRPTFREEERNLEIYLFERVDIICGERIAVEFVEWLRPEKRFEDVGRLRGQIAQDIERAKKILKYEKRK